MKKIRTIFVNSIPVIVSILIGLVILEIGLRVFVSNEKGNPQYIEYENYYTRLKSRHIEYTNEIGQVIQYTTDENGLRNKPDSLDNADVLLLGDSFTMADNTPTGETFADMLRKSGLSVYNAGVNGFSSFHSLSLLKELLPKSNVKLVLLLFYLGNDFRDNFFIADVKLNNSIPEQTNSTTLNNASSKKPFLVKVKYAIAGIIQKSRLLNLLYVHLYVGKIKGMDSNPIADYAVAEFEIINPNHSPELQKGIDNTHTILNNMYDFATQHGAKLIVIGIPSKAQTYRALRQVSAYCQSTKAQNQAQQSALQGPDFDKPDRLLSSITKRLNIPYHSLLTPFRNAHPNQMYYQLDIHWNSRGQEVAAYETIPVLKKALKD